MLSPLTLLAMLFPTLAPQPVDLWGRWDHVLTAATEATADTRLEVTLTAPSGAEKKVLGFWDGQKRWRIRFMPNEAGTWSFRTKSTPAVAGLDDQKGQFVCQDNSTSKQRFLKSGALRLSANGRHLEHADRTPFFWMGDTVWSGPLRADEKDWDEFLDDRVAKKFTVIQFVLTAPWRVDPTSRAGKRAFTGWDTIRIDPTFFEQLDQRIQAINDRGLLAAPVLLWTLGKKEVSPGQLPEAQAIQLARYCVARYQGHYVAWILPGDGRYFGDEAERWKRIGRAVFDQPDHAPVITHPQGMQWPYGERDLGAEKWLTIYGYQSGHGDDADTLRWIYAGPPAQAWPKAKRPIINLEPPYENHLAYQSRKPHSAFNVRRACYWSMLNAPPAGLTYGGHGIWSWQEKPGVPADHDGTGLATPWREAMNLPGSMHMKHLTTLFTSVAWWTLRPAQELLARQPDERDPAKFVAAARNEARDLALIYVPVGSEIHLKAGVLKENLKAEWFDPRTGKRQPAVEPEPIPKAGKVLIYDAPDKQDWVLVLTRK